MRPDVVAVSKDLGGARVAIEALQSAGIDGSHIELLGPSVDLARRRTDTRTPDRQIFRHLAQRIVVGAVVGALLGAAVGAIAGVVAMAVATGADLAVLLLGLVVGAVFGSTLGPFFGVERQIGYSPDWELTFADLPDDSACVGVWAPTRAQRHKAVTTLERLAVIDEVRVRR